MRCPICQETLEVVFRDNESLAKLLHEELMCPRAHYTYQYLFGDEKETYGSNDNKVSFCYSAMTPVERMRESAKMMAEVAQRVRTEDEEVQKVWNEFWRDGLKVNGRFNAWQVKRELFDGEDAKRLDKLDAWNEHLNAKNGTFYGWSADVNHNRISLSDSNLPAVDVRDAIDNLSEPPK